MLLQNIIDTEKKKENKIRDEIACQKKGKKIKFSAMYMKESDSLNLTLENLKHLLVKYHGFLAA